MYHWPDCGRQPATCVSAHARTGTHLQMIWGRAESLLERCSGVGVGRGGGAPSTNNLKIERSCASGRDIIASPVKYPMAYLPVITKEW